MKKVKLAGIMLTIASAFSFLIPSVASAATSACNGINPGGTVASATWGCMNAIRLSDNLSGVTTFDVNGDGRCVNLYTSTLSNPNAWSYVGQNCTGSYVGYTGFTGRAGTRNFRIVRSDGAFYTSIYGI